LAKKNKIEAFTVVV